MKQPPLSRKHVELDTPDSPLSSQILACSRPANPLIGPFEMQIANGPPSFPQRPARVRLGGTTPRLRGICTALTACAGWHASRSNPTVVARCPGGHIQTNERSANGDIRKDRSESSQPAPLRRTWTGQSSGAWRSTGPKAAVPRRWQISAQSCGSEATGCPRKAPAKRS
jgi:hypothetical protein